MMVKIIVLFFVLMVAAAHKHHPKFRKGNEDFIIPVPRKVECTNDHAQERNSIIEKSTCGEPKEVFEYLKPNSAHEQVTPRAVWVKRCVGLCDFVNGGTCVATETVTRHIPVRIRNEKTRKDACAIYAIEEHVSCGCCALEPDECAAPRVYNPRKCSCQCPNMEERRSCLRKRNQNMRWNRSKCTCEVRMKSLDNQGSEFRETQDR